MGKHRVHSSWRSDRERPHRLRTLGLLAGVLAGCALLGGCGDAARGSAGSVLRVGHFANVTHAQGLIGHQLARQGRGWFESRVPVGMTIEWYVYDAGPSAMEPLLAGTIDVAWVGPSPALNAYVRTGGEDVRVVAGAALGGAALVVRDDGGIRTGADFRGRRIGTPQFGNTQDVACRAWLQQQGLRITPTGGDCSIIPTANPDQLSLFMRGDLDGVWTVEPWVSRLELEARGRVLVDERDAITTVLVASARTMKERRAVVRAFVAAQTELTSWMADHGAEARDLVRAEIKATTHQEISVALLEHAWPRLRFDVRPPRDAFGAFLAAARSVGFLTDAPPLDRLVETP